MPAPPENLNNWLELIGYAVGFLAVYLSLRQYYSNSQEERSRWLFELYNRLYGDPELSEMRIRIDVGDTQFVFEEKDHKLMGQLDDFLNFFEFLAYLRKQKRLNRQEMLSMFDYPLRKIAGDSRIRTYVNNDSYGYEGLRELLTEMG